MRSHLLAALAQLWAKQVKNVHQNFALFSLSNQIYSGLFLDLAQVIWLICSRKEREHSTCFFMKKALKSPEHRLGRCSVFSISTRDSNVKRVSKHPLNSPSSNSVDWVRLTPQMLFLPFWCGQHWTPLARKAVCVS